MAEEVVMSAPQDTQTQAESVQAPTTEQNAPAQQEQAQAPQKVKVKVLHEEKELTIDEAVPYIQKGMDYDRVKSNYEKASEDSKFVERLAKKYGMDTSKLKQELEAAAEQQRISELTSQGVPEQLAQEIVEARQYKQERAEQETKAQAEARKAREAAAFVDEYPGVDPNTIPQSVWKDVNEGIPLVHAYARYENQMNRAKAAEVAKAEALAAKNKESASASTGSLAGAPPTSPDFFTAEKVQTMSADEINRNWDKIMASRKHWK